jgi:hypothetical protein
MRQIEIKENIFTNGDEVTVIADYDSNVFYGKINIPEEGNKYYICHNERRYNGDVADEMFFGFAYSYSFQINEDTETIILHRVKLEKLYDDVDRVIKRGVKNFICSVNYNIYSLFNVKLGVIDRYDSITQSEQQGFIDLHSSTRNKKMSIKLGRLIGKLGIAFNEAISKNPKNKPYKIKDELIEKIHNQWMSVNADGLKYEILTGKDILKGYTKANYASGWGTLHNSCMGDKHDFLKIYTENPDKISLLVFYDKVETDKICGRCLLWKCDDGVTYHDRVYYIQDWFEHVLLNLCKKLGYEKVFGSKIEAKVTLDNLDFRKYPYLDTFYGLSFKHKALIYNPACNQNIKYELRTTTGQISEKNANILEQDAV